MITYLKKVLRYYLPENAILLKACRWYINRHTGENNSRMAENGELATISKLAPACRTVIDVGANRGDWSQAVFLVNPTLTIYAFEPDQALCQALIRRFGSKQNFIASCTGLGEFNGKAELFINPQHRGGNSLYARCGGPDYVAKNIETREINVMKLDTFLESLGSPIIDLMKIDVEGGELAVIRGGMKSLKYGLIRRIQFEYGAHWIDARCWLRDMWDVLEPHGFEFYKLHHDGPKRVQRYDTALENFQYANYIVTHQESK
ncbi:MAG: FkbM family methyltransferase [Pseudomonadota bacterium]